MSAIGPSIYEILKLRCPTCGREPMDDPLYALDAIDRATEARKIARAVADERERIAVLVDRAAEDALDDRVATALDMVAARIRSMS